MNVEPENTDPWDIAPQPHCFWIGNKLIHTELCSCDDDYEQSIANEDN